jgi:hypothetical protein
MRAWRVAGLALACVAGDGGAQVKLTNPMSCTAPGVAEAADGVAAQFERHQFVYISSTHGDAKIDEFLSCLVARPGFTRRVTDIIAEWASASVSNQRLMDRYFLALEPIPVDSLWTVWLDTDNPTVWATLPSLRYFFESLRAVNATLPAAKRIRLLGGSDNTEWSKVRTVQDLAAYPFKTNLMEHFLPEHLAKVPGNRTLVVYGDGHTRHNGGWFVTQVDYAIGREKSYVLGVLHERNAGEEAWLRQVGPVDRPFFVTSDKFPGGAGGGFPTLLRAGAESSNSTRLTDYIDGLLYLGPERSRAMIGAIPMSAAMQKELARRAAIMSDGRATMDARYSGRSTWFARHPNEFESRPVVARRP